MHEKQVFSTFNNFEKTKENFVPKSVEDYNEKTNENRVRNGLNRQEVFIEYKIKFI